MFARNSPSGVISGTVSSYSTADGATSGKAEGVLATSASKGSSGNPMMDIGREVFAGSASSLMQSLQGLTKEEIFMKKENTNIPIELARTIGIIRDSTTMRAEENGWLRRRAKTHMKKLQ
jgi:hypothetical protein